MAIREGRWDCTYCGNSGILGRYTTCTGCGRSRPEEVKFYLLEDEAEVSDEKLLNLANDEADWICRYCDSSNRAQYTSCQHCASPREENMGAQQVTAYELGQAPRQGDNTEPAREPVNSQLAAQKSAGRFRWSYVGFSCLGLIILGVMSICSFTLYAGFKTYNVELTVTEVNWSRAVPIEAYRTVVEEDWAVPEAGRMLTQEERVHHYNEVLDHYQTKTREVCDRVKTGTESYSCGSVDKGNGFFEDKTCTRPVYSTRCHDETYKDPIYRQEPVYQLWYSYEIEKWVLDRTETASGTGHEAYWPEYTLAENERIAGERIENYEVHLIDPEGQVYTDTLKYDDWLTYDEKEKVNAEIDFFGEVLNIENGETAVGEN